jgi:hypothetical protein
MKIIMIVVLGIVGSLWISGCNNKNDVHIRINDKGQTLRLEIDANKNGKDIRYRKTFNAEGFAKVEKDSIVNHVLDSLGMR